MKIKQIPEFLTGTYFALIPIDLLWRSYPTPSSSAASDIDAICSLPFFFRSSFFRGTQYTVASALRVRGAGFVSVWTDGVRSLPWASREPIIERSNSPTQLPGVHPPLRPANAKYQRRWTNQQTAHERLNRTRKQPAHNHHRPANQHDDLRHQMPESEALQRRPKRRWRRGRGEGRRKNHNRSSSSSSYMYFMYASCLWCAAYNLGVVSGRGLDLWFSAVACSIVVHDSVFFVSHFIWLHPCTAVTPCALSHQDIHCSERILHLLTSLLTERRPI